jgi:hypothetical protein
MAGRSERGQASVEFLGAAGALLAVGLVCAYGLLASAAWLDARAAAGAADRVDDLGVDPRLALRDSLSPARRSDVRLAASAGDRPVAVVTVRGPGPWQRLTVPAP